MATTDWTADALKAQGSEMMAAGLSPQEMADWAAKEGISLDALAEATGKDPQTLVYTGLSQGINPETIKSIPGAAGLIPFKATLPQPAPQPATWTPTTRSVNPATETIEGRLPGIMSGPLTKQAETRALQNMNDRGLVNSSMATTAAEDAMLRAAVPIAAADAGTYSNVANLNQGYQNQAGQFNAGQANEFGLTQMRGQLDRQLQELRGGQAENLAKIEGTYRSAIQTIPSATSLYNNAIDAMERILSNTEFDQGSKQVQVNALMRMMNNALAVLSGASGLNLRSLLTFS